MTAMAMVATTRNVINRFTNSTSAWYSSGATSWSSWQLGQSEQPSPEPVRRTAAPLTTMNTWTTGRPG